MPEHRFRDLFVSRHKTAEGMGGDAFVAVPLAEFVAGHQHASHVAEVYRLAAERTRAQLKPARRWRAAEFSVN